MCNSSFERVQGRDLLEASDVMLQQERGLLDEGDDIFVTVSRVVGRSIVV